MSSAVYYLALPSLIVFGLLILHSFSNRGRRLALVYFGSISVYGWIRALWLQHITKDELGSAFPYLINLPVLKIGGASLQEIVGWSVAATLAWLISDRILRRLHLIPGPHRTAALSVIVMGAVCLAVETAAIEAGWWQWTLILKERTVFGRVPLVGLLDWGFVAFDFLLPFLVLSTRTPWSQRIPALSLFFLHFYFHPKTRPLSETMMLSPNDLMHAAILAYVLVVALNEKTDPVLQHPSVEKRRWIPLVSAGIVVLATAASNVFEAKLPASAVYSTPLLILAVAAYAFPWAPQSVEKGAPKKKKKQGPAPVQDPSWELFAARLGVVVLVFVFVYMFRAPFYRRTEAYLTHLNHGIALMNEGRWTQAETELRKGIDIRAEHPGGHVLLGQVLFLQDRVGEARSELQTALHYNPTDLSGLSLMGAIEIREGRWEEAGRYAATGMRAHPDRIEFRYLAALAQQKGLTEQPYGAVLDLIREAKVSGSGSVNALGLTARNANDMGTLRALQSRTPPAQR